jgi:hypothetical protein
MWDWMIYTVLFLLAIIIAWEWLRDRMVAEGFTDGDKDIPEFFARYFPRRYDVVPGQVKEGGGWVRNGRYFEGYVDVQKLGYKADFCRVVEKEGDPDSRIMACALAGQEGLDSFTYRTDSARSGFTFSRDDYFRDVNGDKRDDYCRIVKVAKAPKDAWEARCIPGGLARFKQGSELTDNDPPEEVADLLWFYEGAMVWYRFYDDILDYAANTQIKLAGGVGIDETPKKPTTDGLGLNRILAGGDSVTQTADQFLKIGENSRLEFDSVVDLRQLRGISVWAYFDEFTNNARIFDFGNGAGKSNVLLGIQARGNRAGSGFGAVGARPNPSNLVCQAKAPEEVSPYVFMKSTDANVDEWTCPATEPVDSMFPPDENEEIVAVPTTANLLFEIWDESQRKMRIVIPDAVPLKKWAHIALTTTDMDPVRPVWQVWVDRKKVFENLDGFLPTKSYTQKNYIGRSNWEGVTSQYQDRDERFRGALFDFRLYRIPMGEGKVRKTYDWGYGKLGLGKREE